MVSKIEKLLAKIAKRKRKNYTQKGVAKTDTCEI
jgi:hypothetical protein